MPDPRHPADGWTSCRCFAAEEPRRDPQSDRIICPRCELPITGNVSAFEEKDDADQADVAG